MPRDLDEDKPLLKTYSRGGCTEADKPNRNSSNKDFTFILCIKLVHSINTLRGNILRIVQIKQTEQDDAEAADSSENRSTSITSGVTQSCDTCNSGVSNIADIITSGVTKWGDAISLGVTKSCKGLNSLIRHAMWTGVDGDVCYDTAAYLDLIQHYCFDFYPWFSVVVFPVYCLVCSRKGPSEAIHIVHFRILCGQLVMNYGTAALDSMRYILHRMPTPESDSWAAWLRPRYPVIPRHPPILISSMNLRASFFLIANFSWYSVCSKVYPNQSKAALYASLVPLALHGFLLSKWIREKALDTIDQLDNVLEDKSIELPTSREALTKEVKRYLLTHNKAVRRARRRAKRSAWRHEMRSLAKVDMYLFYSA